MKNGAPASRRPGQTARQKQPGPAPSQNARSAMPTPKAAPPACGQWSANWESSSSSMRQPVKQLAVVLTTLKREQPSQRQIRLQALARFQVNNNFATAGGRNLQMMNYAEIFKIVHDGCILHFVNNAAYGNLPLKRLATGVNHGIARSQ